MEYINKLKETRKKNGYTQQDMAELLETTQQQYSKYEKGLHELPIRHLITICRTLKVSSDWLLGIWEEDAAGHVTK